MTETQQPRPADLKKQVDSQVISSELTVKAKYIPSEPQTTDVGYGVVHLYRDREPLSWLEQHKGSLKRDNGDRPATDGEGAYVDNDLTTLCILAVPSYMTPSDLLGWVGEENREKVSHFRLIRTGRSNKYMVLLKFRESGDARQWQKSCNGRLFNSMEPENCHVVFIRSIRFEADTTRDPTHFPDTTNDPFKPTGTLSVATKPPHENAGKVGAALNGKPAPPPTPSLLELPTCPVCLERMDETTGLATIFCQHVFHCACLQKWRGSGCPVCRYTQDDLASRHAEDKKEPTECAVCGSCQSLWICLICGHTGCGRYESAHAFAHYSQTSHAFAMDISTQHIWNYDDDEYVHRLIQNTSDHKLIELPSSKDAKHSFIDDKEEKSDVPADKLEKWSLEYTHLLTSQLESQRHYFSLQVSRAVDKASLASTAADDAAARAVAAYSRLEALEAMNGAFANDTVPALERDLERAERRARKAESIVGHLQNEGREKEVIGDSLMERIVHLEKQLGEAQAKATDLEEQNRDLSFFISGMEKLKDQGEEVREGTAVVADAAAAEAGKGAAQGSMGKSNKKKQKKKPKPSAGNADAT